MRKIYVISLILLFLLFGVFVFSFISKTYKVSETLIRIKKHTNSKQIADILAKKGIIKYPNIFYLYVRIFNYDKNLQAGTYLFRGDLNIPKIAKILRKGRVYLEKITFPEGWTYKKMGLLLAKRGFVHYKRFISLCEDSLFVKKTIGYGKRNIEGFLYPDTYYFPKGVSEEFIINSMVDNFNAKTKDLTFPNDYKLDFYQTIILASIVERESGLPEEKPIIAGVYMKRLLKGYKLQADPTVAYALEIAGKSRKKLYYKDLEINSDYNTYLHKGLPPTPISNPSLETIKAVVYYQPTDYLFFFANRGKHIFSKSYRNHIIKQNRIKFSR